MDKLINLHVVEFEPGAVPVERFCYTCRESYMGGHKCSLFDIIKHRVKRWVGAL